MKEHKFLLDLDDGLRKEVKLKVERETADREFRVTKRHARRIIVRALLSIPIAVAVYKLFLPQIGQAGAFCLGAILWLVANCNTIPGIVSVWRDFRRRKKQLQSWDALISDYNESIRLESRFGRV